MPKNSAEALLRRVWADRGFPVDPAWIAGQLGLDVVETDLDSNISGALHKDPGHDPVIILNREDSRSRKRFTCAHELGHYAKRTDNGQELEYQFIDFRGEQATKGCDPDEIFANQFAANLLMPEYKVRELHKEGCPATIMASFFGVSDDAIKFRLKNLRIN